RRIGTRLLRRRSARLASLRGQCREILLAWRFRSAGNMIFPPTRRVLIDAALFYHSRPQRFTNAITWRPAGFPSFSAAHHSSTSWRSRCHNAFISPRHKKPKNKGGGHGDRGDRRLLTLWNGVHRMQRPAGRTEVVGVCEQT